MPTCPATISILIRTTMSNNTLLIQTGTHLMTNYLYRVTRGHEASGRRRPTTHMSVLRGTAYRSAQDSFLPS